MLGERTSRLRVMQRRQLGSRNEGSTLTSAPPAGRPRRGWAVVAWAILLIGILVTLTRSKKMANAVPQGSDAA